MNHIELHIRSRDWIIIIFIGVLVSSILSMIIYYLFDLSLFDGFVFGVLLGGLITVFAMFFISVLNNHILPDVAKKYWLISAILFSFLSGFCGSSVALLISNILDIAMIDKVTRSSLFFSGVMGVLTYLVGALTYAMVKMANLKEENEQKLLKSRLVSLEAQLNPHFLFNSLNSLVELIHVDTSKSEKLILKLSQFLRHTMEEKPLVTIEDEIKNIDSYIELENIRFEDKIIVNSNIDIEFKYKMIPKFSIQLIVENAIKHGMIQGEPLEINIEVQKGEPLNILVSNNGKKIENKEFGIGLRNLHERLKILCNGEIEVVDLDNPTYKISIGKYSEDISSR